MNDPHPDLHTPPAPAGVRLSPWKYLGLVALLFVLMVGGWMWALLNQTGAGRDYAQAALAAAQAKEVPAAGLACAELVGKPLPSNVESCVVRAGTPPTAELSFDGGRRGVVQAKP